MERLPRKTYRVDLCAEAINDPDFWDMIAEGQHYIDTLPAKSWYSPAAMASHDKVITNIHDLLGYDPDLPERMVSAVGTLFRRENSRSPLEPLGICGVVGVMAGATTVDLPPSSGRRAKMRTLALEIADRFQPAASYFIPLTKEDVGGCMLESSVDVPYPMLNNTAAFLQREGARFQTIVTSRAFFERTAKKQRNGLDQMLSELNKAVTPYNVDGYEIAVKCQSYWQIHHEANGDNQVVEAPFTGNTTRVTGSRIRIILPEYTDSSSTFCDDEFWVSGGMPHAELVDPDNDRTFWIPIDGIKTIHTAENEVQDTSISPSETNAELTTTEIDLIAEIFQSPGFIDAVEYAETQALSVDETERAERSRELVGDVNEHIPEDLMQKPCRLKGTVHYYTESDTESYKDMYICTDNVTLYGAGIVDIEGRPRVVIEIGLPSKDSSDETIAFFMPNSPLVKEFVSYDDDSFMSYNEAPATDLIGCIDESAKKCRDIIQSPDFRSSPKSQQIWMLEPFLDKLNTQLRVLQPARKEERIRCNTARYFAIPKELWYNLPLSEMRITDHSELPNSAHRYPQGTRIYADIPELRDEQLECLRGLKSFTISKGEPMIILDDRDAKIVYFIRSADILGFDAIDPTVESDDE